MGIMDTAAQAAAARRQPFGGLTNPTNGNAADRPKAQLWLNIGYQAANGVFIDLPGAGIALDTMSEAPVRGQNEDWVKRRQAQNQLLAMLIKAGAELAPGQEEDVNLTIRMRRVKGDLVVAAEENEYAIDLASLFSKPANELPAE